MDTIEHGGDGKAAGEGVGGGFFCWRHGTGKQLGGRRIVPKAGRLVKSGGLARVSAADKFKGRLKGFQTAFWAYSLWFLR